MAAVRHRLQGLGGLWQNADFLKFWAGEAVSEFGTQISLLALPLVAVVTLQASPAQMGLLTAAATAPALVLGIPAGMWVDRARRRPILLGASVTRAVLLASIPIAALLDQLNLLQLYVVALMTGTMKTLFDTAYQSYLPTLISRKKLFEANGKLAITRSLAQTAGPALAGVLISLITAPLAIALDAISFAFSAVSLMLIRRPERAPAHRMESQGLWRESVEGLSFVVRHPLLRPMIGATSILLFFFGMILALEILYMERTLDLSTSAIGGILAMRGLSAVVGALVITRITHRIGAGWAIILASLLFVAGDLLFVVAAGSLVVKVSILLLSQVLVGLARPLYTVTLVSLRQTVTPNHLLGRVTSSSNVVTQGIIPLGALLGGLLGGQLGLRASLVVAVLGTLVAFIWLAISPLSRLRGQAADEESGPEM